ncbi:histone-lysine N-methyltransferase, H3 lysine-9 specific SUVH1-like [Mangifera indica]|uniref:histone-lysine N-methyltransferase, H3 lysine-9 specific SUVH1-like n=1 Tax=Mangifera indica TaxID=29780 RepID=UPI001CFB5BE3|nr:histone-lysine N-methyltransferase, H3 lysine-9 specific SUVH1-like [Mangifera indica]XP_044461870.1 histone-lysine N-methyltransferase, H3 lysine-9 specific SUVH1-like [Mangifera indica]XP_044461871.1 histone-lysine N-methyltransferase, H3 lysine-9 specific SUVH1-like [Mangifera indica]XP_044461872.1 histone-lysine N-methyltransferase, H3 lysine-9 specific SUVH1-like [Mangifera indica]XP_044461873.1 histone-lysine N-methyltransferase, H3 lysine-9 specific SUVH1-like [Mangifera indica]
MEGGSDYNTIPQGPIDKTKVLDVKPLRMLYPMLPSKPEGPAFVCAPPDGPFPAGFSPFYPFIAPQNVPNASQNNHSNQAQTPASFASPIRSFRPPEINFSDVSNGDVGSSVGKNKHGKVPNSVGSGAGQKKARRRGVRHLVASSSEDFVVGLSSYEQDEGNRQVVNSVLTRFDALRRRLSQIEDAKESPTGIIRRADLKAGNILLTKGVRTNTRKRVGAVSGVEVGDIFFFRMELCVVGLHSQSMAGIDYMISRGDLEEAPVALSIVSSGGYDDDAEDSDILVYTGQGGNANKKDKQSSDQKLERGNLALERSFRRGNEIRVIRGMKDGASLNTKVYVYDGLYRIQESWMEKGKSGCNMFKYKLVRMPGQPGAFSVWKLIQKWKDNLSSRVRLIIPDLTSGAESIPVSLVNDVDDEKGPAYFTYFPRVKNTKSFRLTQPSFGCNCHSACLPGNPNCSCMQKNGGNLPYTANGVLVSRKPMIYECGPSCPCTPNCKNRVSQTGLRFHLEVFKTKDKGWALRSWDPVRAGSFICEYAGEVVDKVKSRQDGEEVENDDYVFDTTRVYDSFKWNYEPGLIVEDDSNHTTEEYNIPFPLIISSKNAGNVARFMNHSCSPNVFWQPVMFEQNNETFLHIAFFAMRHIPPMTELTYDYGIACSDEGNSDTDRKRKCLCGSPRCRGYFG